jgi:hypothetical protein
MHRDGPHRLPRSGTILLMCATLAWSWPTDTRAEDNPLAVAVKAAYIAKFIPFIQWPPGAFAQPAAPVNICIGGVNPFGDLLDKIVEGQMIDGRPMAVRHLRVIARDSGCHLVFAAGSDEQTVAEILTTVRGTPVLTLTDAASGPLNQGIINFVIVDNRVRFEIDMTAASRNGLAISSKLMALAVRALGAR